MNLDEFTFMHFGEYAKIGAESGWMWIGDINDHTVPEINEILIFWRRRWWSQKNRTRLADDWIPAERREIVASYKSELDGALLVKIKGHEFGNQWTIREKKIPYEIPQGNYTEIAGEAVKMAGADLRNAMLTLTREEFRFYSKMTTREADFESKLTSKTLIECEKSLHECIRFFESDLYEIFCPTISSAEVMQMAEKAVRRELMQDWKEKAEIYEKRIRKNRSSNH